MPFFQIRRREESTICSAIMDQEDLPSGLEDSKISLDIYSRRLRWHLQPILRIIKEAVNKRRRSYLSSQGRLQVAMDGSEEEIEIEVKKLHRL